MIANKSTIMMFIGSLFFLVFVSISLLNKIKNQNLEEERRKLALQVLTHEFRTPVSSMLLQIERGNRHYSSLTNDMQEVFMRLSGDVYRLQRLTEMSKNYLMLHNRNSKLIWPKKTKINSINSFFLGFSEDYKINFSTTL